MADQLKLQVLATLDQTKSQKEIQAQLKIIQDKVKFKVTAGIDNKAVIQGLKTYEQMQSALNKTFANQRQELERQELRHAHVVSECLDKQYAQRSRNLAIENRSNLPQFDAAGQTSPANLNSFTASVSSISEISAFKDAISILASSIIGTETAFAGASKYIDDYNVRISDNTAISKGFLDTIKQTDAGLYKYLSNLGSAPASMTGYKASLKAASLATVGLAAKTLLLNTALSFGIGAAISVAILGFQKLYDWLVVTKEEAQEFTSKIESIENEIKELTIKQEDGSITDSEKLRLELLKAQSSELQRQQKITAEQAYNQKYGKEKTIKLRGKYTVQQGGFSDTHNAINEYQRLEGQKSSLDPANKDDLKTLEQIEVTQNNLRENLLKTGMDLADFKDLMGELPPEAQGALDAILGIVEAYNSQVQEATIPTTDQERLANEYKSGKISLEEYSAALSKLKQNTAEYEKKAYDVGVANNYLASVSEKVAKSESLTSEEKDKLIAVFPGLQNAIYQTADGWSVEKTAVDLLSGSLTSLQIAHKTVNDIMTNDAAIAALGRLGILKSELSGIQSVSDSYKLISDQAAKKGIPFNQIYDPATGEAIHTGAIEAINFGRAMDTITAKMEEINTKALGSGSKGSGSKSSGTSEDTWLKAFSKDLANLKHNREMDKVSAEQYYTALAALNKKYFQGREKYLEQYRQYEEEVYKGGMELYDARLTKSKRYMEDRNLYNNWGADSEIQALERIRKYTEEYYQKGILSYEKYADQIRELNSSLYAALKSNYEKIYKGMQSAALTQLEKEKEALQNQLNKDSDNYINKDLDEKIKKNKEQLDLMEQQADEEDRLFKIEKARIALAKARDQKTTRIYREGQGFVWEANQQAVKDAQNEVDELEKDWNKYQEKLKLEGQIKKWEAAKEENEKNINAQIKNLEKLSAAWSDSLNLDDDIIAYSGDLKTLLGTESTSYEERLRLAREFAEEYKRIMAEARAAAEGEVPEKKPLIPGPENNRPKNSSDSDPSKQNEYTTIGTGSPNAPAGMKVGTIVTTGGGKYMIVEPYTEGAKKGATGNWSIPVYAQGGVADFTGMAQLDGSPSKAETIFNSTDSKKLYDIIHNSSISDISSRILGNLKLPHSLLLSPAQSSDAIQLNIGDIYLSGVQDVNSLSKAIVQKLPNQLLQNLYKRS